MAFHTCTWNTLTKFSLLWFLTPYLWRYANASERYPYVLPKCCQSDGSAIAKSFSRASMGTSMDFCKNDKSVVVVLPKQLFPAMSTKSDHVEVELRNILGGLNCDGKQQSYLDMDLTDNKAIKPVSIGKKDTFNEVAFSRDTFLAPDGHIYTPGHFCISSRLNSPTGDFHVFESSKLRFSNRTTNKNRLAIKTCKRKCSLQHPCIRRCCGGHQSILQSLPSSSNESFLDFCSSPSLRNDSWNPWTSTIVRGIFNESYFYQTSYTPYIMGIDGQPVPKGSCSLLRFTDTALMLLRNGRLIFPGVKGDGQITFYIEDNFCLDGVNGVAGGNIPLGDNCEASEAKETVIAYVCTRKEAAPFPKNLVNTKEEDIISLPACSCLVKPPKYPFPFPLISLPKNQSAIALVRLMTVENGGNLDCLYGYEDVSVEYRHLTKELFFLEGLLVFRGALLSQSGFCIKSVFHDAVAIRACKVEYGSGVWVFTGWKWWMWLVLTFTLFLPILLQLFYVAIAVVYILRKDKDLVLRCSIVGYSVSSILFNFLILCNLFITGIDEPITRFIIDIGMNCSYMHALSWMSVLCFDAWFNITFLRPGKKSTKRLWGYVTFCFTLPAASIAYTFIKRFIGPNVLSSIVLDYLDYLPYVVGLSIPILNFLLFMATAMKLWKAQNSSGIKTQRKTFRMHFKLFLLMGSRWTIELFFAFYSTYIIKYNSMINLVIFMLPSLHPVILFFFLIWDAETQTYLEANHSRIKGAMDFLGGIGYPVRKCWGLCRRCKRHQEYQTNGIEEIEPPHNSNHMYVHTRRAPNIPKRNNSGLPANPDQVINENGL